MMADPLDVSLYRHRAKAAMRCCGLDPLPLLAEWCSASQSLDQG
jgi:hypothetical protein